MNTFIALCVAGVVALSGLAGLGIYLGVNYSYHWKQACAATGGVRMENTSGEAICVKAPVQIVTIAVNPW